MPSDINIAYSNLNYDGRTKVEFIGTPVSTSTYADIQWYSPNTVIKMKMPEEASIIGGLQVNALVFTTLKTVLNDPDDLYDKLQPVQGYQYIDMSKTLSYSKSSVSVSNPGNQKLSRNNPTIQLQGDRLIVPRDLGGDTYWHIYEGEGRATISDSGLLTLIEFDDTTPIGVSYGYIPHGFVIDQNSGWEFPPYNDGGYWLEDTIDIEIEVDNT